MLKTSKILCLALFFSAISNAYAAPTGLRVGIYSGTGAEADKTLALYRAVAAMGHHPLGLTRETILGGHLTRANIDVFIIPDGEDGVRSGTGHYADSSTSLGGFAMRNAIRSYLNSGGGLVAMEAGAYFASLNGGALDVYRANYQWTTPVPAKRTLTITDPTFGSGDQEAWQSYGGGYFSVASNATVVARDTLARPVIVRASYNAGRVVLTSFELSLRGDSELDWTIWDNWAMGGVHNNSEGAWVLLGRMINFAYNGDSSAPVINSSNPTGAPVAVIATHTTDGGQWPGLLPDVGRALEYSGNVPLAIRFQEIKDNRLTLDNFKAVFFDGGYAYGFLTGLSGYEQRIRDFVSSGGGYWGDCAGSFYPAAVLNWAGVNYNYPLDLYQGTVVGPINDIIPWPQYALTPININDPVVGNLGTTRQLYYGGGYFNIPTDAQQGSHVYTVGTFAYSGSAAGKAAAVRYTYGAGHVMLVTSHLQAWPGHELFDWTEWDDYLLNGTTSLSNPDNTWNVFSALINNWVLL
jgi:glutamine amidotransferase-like uncharacterized protein